MKMPPTFNKGIVSSKSMLKFATALAVAKSNLKSFSLKISSARPFITVTFSRFNFCLTCFKKLALFLIGSNK